MHFSNILSVIGFLLLVKLHRTNCNGYFLKTNQTFWQLTDIHWDINYSESGDQASMCHKNVTNSHNGHFGSFFCDSPWTLVNATIHAMKTIDDTPEFILWTGDIAPHTSLDESDSFPTIYSILKNVTSELGTLFGKSVDIIPVLGNHDVFPRNEYPSTAEGFYNHYLESGWGDIIPEYAVKDFKQGGFYEYKISQKFSVVVLNTNLYYNGNTLGTNQSDPSGQFEWLRIKFEQAKKANRKFLIAAHSPPGFWERYPAFCFFNETYNDKYVDLLNEFGDIITAQVYGHLHTDTFRIFEDRQGTSKSVAFMAPAVTPLKIYFSSRIRGGINPSIRLYGYNNDNIVDYIQYHLNLTEYENSSCIVEHNSKSTNELPTDSDRSCEAPKFKKYYQATEMFSVESLDLKNMKLVFNKLRSDAYIFKRYFDANDGGHLTAVCNNTCREDYLCTVTNLHIKHLKDCIAQNPIDYLYPEKIDTTSPVSHISEHIDHVRLSKNDDRVGSHSFMTITVGIAALSFVLIIVVLLLGVVSMFRKRKILAAGNAPLSEYEWINNRHGGGGYSQLNENVD